MSQTTTTPVKLAVVTGGHSYDVPNFHALFRALPGVDAYIQHMDDFASSSKATREGYDAVLFFTMATAAPTDDGPWYAGKPLTALSELGETSQGIVMLHHALVDHHKWEPWEQMTGCAGDFRDYHVGETVTTLIADAAHPITAGLESWTMTDETYEMSEPFEGSHVLLTSDHPRSMTALAWTRQYRQSRVFCYQAGHDNATWADTHFREVLARGIAWAAGRL